MILFRKIIEKINMGEQKNLWLAIGLSIVIIVIFQILFPQQAMMPPTSKENTNLVNQSTSIDEVMSANYKFISSNSLATEAALLMQSSNVYVLIIKNTKGAVEGIVKMHDLLKANVI